MSSNNETTLTVVELQKEIPLSVGPVVKTIVCPNAKCRRGIYLKAALFTIEVDETDGSWCAENAVICQKCKCEFWIVWSEIIWVKSPR